LWQKQKKKMQDEKFKGWHEEEKNAEKVHFTAFKKVGTTIPLKWFIRKDRLDRCPLFQALFFNRSSDCVLVWNELPSVFPTVKDAREMYHLMNWINRDSLVLPSLLSLNRCLELADQYGITKNNVRQELNLMIQQKYEVVTLFTHSSGCVAQIEDRFSTHEQAVQLRNDLTSKCVNPHFMVYIRERDDNKPFGDDLT
jgi:hypothetical protein